MIEIIKYQVEDKERWNLVVSSAGNGYFMFERQYMDYHEDRHIDCSYLVLYKGTPIGALPATQVDKKWISHGGLTFGGLILQSKYNKITHIIEIYDKLFSLLKERGFQSAFIKPLPWIYHTSVCEGEIYAIHQFKNVATQPLFEITTTVELAKPAEVSKLRLRKKNQALKNKLKVIRSDNISGFYSLLKQRLDDKYEKQPVHSLEELQLLSQRFPNNISLYTVINEQGIILGGSVIYSSNNVWHSQYVSANEVGMEVGALDLLFFELINMAKECGAKYFDFGISTEDNGLYLNKSLVNFKEGFGGRSIMHQKIHVCLKKELFCE